MTRQQEAITYFESQKKRLEDFRKIYPSPNTVGYQATTKEISFYDMAISALSENKGEWIPVSERLPEKEKERYLIDYEHEGEEYITVSYYDKYGFWSSSEVKAWQPLPEPYKGE